ncbi:YchJ family protein [Roseibium aggregatum]|uniref:YchJ family protein n=1 Tax=Roseibium aggregatum TaxID=187304 RepID=A0A926NT19_9HYPH|nr:YchJ family protein [Roseibium aggregatum]MBD1546882.1 YchJ family protein [Roseibium aggregatum]
MSESDCPCGSGRSLSACCGPCLAGERVPETAEALMRSRYTAYVLQQIDYLKDTLWPKEQARFDFAGTARWAAENHWTGLTVLKTEKGTAEDREGTVLFEAKFLAGVRFNTHRELSRFRKKAGRWYYVEALPESQA